MEFRSAAHSVLYRWVFVVCVYTGLRAAFNRSSCWLQRGRTPVARRHGMKVCVEDSGAMRAFVHLRSRSRMQRAAGHVGMISLQQERPIINRVLHRYLCLTSHFGCGQVEVAFYETGGQVTIYAVRNTARANAHRLGWRTVARRLGSDSGEIHVLRALVPQLERVELSTRLAPAEKCVGLAVNDRLVPPRSLRRTRAALEQKYQRLHRALEGADAKERVGAWVEPLERASEMRVFGAYGKHETH